MDAIVGHIFSSPKQKRCSCSVHRSSSPVIHCRNSRVEDSLSHWETTQNLLHRRNNATFLLGKSKFLIRNALISERESGPTDKHCDGGSILKSYVIPQIIAKHVDDLARCRYTSGSVYRGAKKVPQRNTATAVAYSRATSYLKKKEAQWNVMR